MKRKVNNLEGMTVAKPFRTSYIVERCVFWSGTRCSFLTEGGSSIFLFLSLARAGTAKARKYDS